MKHLSGRIKQFRVNGLSFKSEIRGKPIQFDKKIVYLGLNGVLESCNWNCKYCLEGLSCQRKSDNESRLSLERQLELIDEAKGLGIKCLLITGGEPFAPNRRNETLALVMKAYRKNIVPLIYTNGWYIDRKIAEDLADNGASIALKIDSLIPKKYDAIVQRRGAFKKTLESIEIIKKTTIAEPVAENDSGVLVRMLFTTVGNALNVDEYASIARFATNNGARWMMEFLNPRGSARNHSDLTLDSERHMESMRAALALNPQQRHSIGEQGYCRLFYMVTINTSSGDFGSCPQDYNYTGNIKAVSLERACRKILENVSEKRLLESWSRGKCPIKGNCL